MDEAKKLNEFLKNFQKEFNKRHNCNYTFGFKSEAKDINSIYGPSQVFSVTVLQNNKPLFSVVQAIKDIFDIDKYKSECINTILNVLFDTGMSYFTIPPNTIINDRLANTYQYNKILWN